MKHLLITTALCLAATTAWAGGSGHAPAPTPNAITYNAAGAVAGAAAHSQASAGATAQGGRATARTGPVTVNNSTGGGYGGGGYSARGNTPDVILGSVSGGDPCGLGAGGNGSGPGAGAALIAMFEGSGCQRLEDAKMLNNLGFSRIAIKDRLCEGGSWFNANHFRKTFWNAGDPCPDDVADFAKARQAQGYYQRADGYWVK